MTNEIDTQNQEEAPGDPAQSSGLDDSRFEVKWRKKESSASTATPPTPSDTLGEDIDSLRRRLAEAEQRASDLQERWHRSAADLSNLRKRTEQDRGDLEKYAAMMLVAELLPVLDNFDRALATIPGNLAMLTWIQGVILIERHLRAILEHQGVQPIEAENQQFNPHVHEAIAERPTDAVAPGMVVQVLQQGYTMHGRVIRPALVELAAAPETTGEELASETTDAVQAAEIAREAETENTGP